MMKKSIYTINIYLLSIFSREINKIDDKLRLSTTRESEQGSYQT